MALNFPIRARGLFRIQYASDLHLELSPIHGFQTMLTPVAPYLALAGDIGHERHWTDLLTWASPRWRRIFFVAGEHDILPEDFKQANVHFLNQRKPSVFLEEENVAIVGSDLGPQKEYWSNHGARLCVLTHNPPNAQSAGLATYPVRAWIHGKTHTASTFILGGGGSGSGSGIGKQKQTLCCTNARGSECYGISEVAGFSPIAFLDIPWEDPAEVEDWVKRPMADFTAPL